MLPADLTLRPETEKDREFLCHLYGTTREAELAVTGWSPEEKAAFVRQQFEAQTAHYAKAYLDGEFHVIELGGRPIGRLYLFDVHPQHLLVVDLALLPEVTGRGIGSAIIRDLIFARAAASGKSVTGHVDAFGPARALYKRLGFIELEDKGHIVAVEWHAPPTTD